ncbi:MAG: S1/P1 nuclease [Bacteroidales bacterium]|nr:S1/P1 nuclease [Bacteroidales bacterium]
MRRIVFLCLCALACIPMSGWGRLGHYTVAEIDQRHLTPKAEATIMAYTGGAPLADFAVWMDVVAKEEPYKTVQFGWHASVANPDCESPLYVRKAVRDCRDGVTAMEYFRALLEDNYQEMEDSVVLDAIKCMVHIVADFHCPVHLRYTDCVNDGKFQITFNGKEVRYHTFWDTNLLQYASGLNWKQYSEYADRLDTWNKKQIKAAQKGWAREWFEDAARCIRPMIDEVRPGDALDGQYVEEHIGLAEDLLRKSAYQLAAALNQIFG